MYIEFCCSEKSVLTSILVHLAEAFETYIDV